MSAKSLGQYNKDFYAWTIYNAALIRQGNFSKVDIEHVAEEIESMGKRERRELINRLSVLIAHLLKWQFQPARRCNSWKYTIEEQRNEITDLFDDSPSLKHEIDQQLDRAYAKAVLIAATETDLGKEVFPKSCSFSLKQALSQNFFPEKN